mgnify:CR=1 FL=1
MEKIELKIPNINETYKIFVMRDAFHTSVFIDTNSSTPIRVAVKCYILRNKISHTKWSPEAARLLQHVLMFNDPTYDVNVIKHLQNVQNAIDNYMLENIRQYILPDFNV